MKKAGLKRGYFAMPYVVLSVIFVVIPLFILLINAFIGDNGGFTLMNFVDFFRSPSTLKVMGRSFGIAILTTLICLAIAYPLAMILANSKFNKSAILVMLFVVPMWINSLLRTYAIKTIFDMINMTNPYWSVVIGMVYDFFPFMLLPIYTILVNMDKSYVEAAYDLGASSSRAFLKVTLPLSAPGIVSGILMVFMPTVSTFAISDILGDVSTFMLGNIINFWFEKGFYNLGSAYAFILLVIILLTMFIANKVTNGKASVTGGGLVK